MQEKDGERHFRRCLRTLSVLKWRYCRLIKTLQVKSGTAAYKRWKNYWFKLNMPLVFEFLDLSNSPRQNQ